MNMSFGATLIVCALAISLELAILAWRERPT